MVKLRNGVVGLLSFFVVFIFITPVFSQTSAPDVLSSITAEKVKPHIVTLADDKLEGRGGGYKGERKAADYIANEFKRIGLKPYGDPRGGKRSYFQEFRFQPYHPVKPWEVMTSRNVLGFIEGSDQKLKGEVIIIGAHYDGQGMAGQADPTRQPAAAGAPADDIWNSANDNATSVAAIIEIARAIKSSGEQPKRSILFIAFGAEEHGMIGSIYYVNHPEFPIGDHIAMINLEKLGRAPEKPFNIAGVASSKAWPEMIKAAHDATNTKIASGPFAFPDSDHYAFGSARIPAVIISVSTNLDVHQPSDTADKVDFARTAEAARFAMSMVSQLAAMPERPGYVPSPIPDMGLIAHLITGAEADQAGLPAGESGLKVTGVINGLPAAAAGLTEGDLILAVGNTHFRREDSLPALMAMHQDILMGKMGSVIPVKVQRNKKTVELTLTLKLGH